mgnify:CR=1 FL=1
MSKENKKQWSEIQDEAKKLVKKNNKKKQTNNNQPKQGCSGWLAFGVGFFIFILFRSCGGGKGPDGIYYVGPSEKNSSFISFSPPNKYHKDYITWTGNRRNGLSNCKTRGDYTYDKKSKTLIVSGFYNSNCSSISSRNGTWKIKGNYIISPGGVKWKKE